MADYRVPIERRSKPCRFRNLTEVEKNVICNGCGAKGGWFKPPEYCFTASCNRHDFSYWLGGESFERKRADEGFLRAMIYDAYWMIRKNLYGRPVLKRRPWWRRYWLKGAAYRYHWAVRLGGKKSFNYHALEHRNEQWSRLEKLMTARGFDVEANFDKEDWE